MMEGLNLIVPSAVTATGSGSSASVTAEGKITFSGTTIRVDGCFSTTYEMYYVAIAFEQGYDIRVQLSAGGVVESSGAYDWQRLRAQSTTVDATRSLNQTAAAMAFAEFDTYVGLYFSQPANSGTYTSIRSIVGGSRSTPNVQDHSGSLDSTSAYDGFQLTGSTPPAAGVMTIYGFTI